MNKSNKNIFIVDFLAINLAYLFYYFFRTNFSLYDEVFSIEFFLPMLIIYFYWLLIFMFVGLYRSWFASSRLDEISLIFKASFVGIFILFFLIFLDDFTHGVSSENRFLIFIYWIIFFFSIALARLILRSIQRNLLIKGIGRKNALIIGFNDRGKEIQDQITKHPALGYDIIGYITVSEELLDKSYNEKKVLAHLNELENTIQSYNVKEVIISLQNHHDDLIIELMSRCENLNVGLKIVPDLYEILSGQVRTMQLYSIPLIDVVPQLMPEWEKKAKRIFDIIISFVFLLLSTPIIILISIAIKIDSKGPVFFKQERCGLNGKIFKVLKFRSMFKDAEKETGPVWSSKDDPRITSVGKFIRKVRMDELPQMINVLKGDMSLVGPRPERPYFVDILSKEIPYYKRRLRVRPGVTGWAQVKHKYDENIDDVKAKLKFDLFYIENMSLRTDFKILFRTIFVVLFGKGHYE